MTTTTASPTIAALRAAEQRYDDATARLIDKYRRRLDVLFAADLDQLLADGGPDTQAMPAVRADSVNTAEVRWVPTVPDRAELLTGLERLHRSPLPEPGAAAQAFLAQGPNDDDMPGTITSHLAYDPGGLQPPTRGPLRRAWNRAVDAVARLGAGQEQR